MSFQPIWRGMSSAHIPTIQAYTHLEREREREMQWDILCEKKTVWFCFMCCACN